MKAITCLIGLFLLFLASPAKAQSDGDEIPWSINSGTMVGIGSYNLMDTYLSPSMEDKKYTGPGLRVMNERMKRVRLANYRVSRQQIISVDLASTDNAASTATDFAGFIDYTLGYYYHLPTVLPDLKLLAGGAVHGMGGFIYNTRNGNNPASAKADITTAAAVGSQPAQTQGLAASRADFQRNLVVCATHTAGLALEAGHDVLHRLLESLQRIVAGLLLNHGECLVNDLLSDALLAIQHNAVDQTSDHLGIVNRIS